MGDDIVERLRAPGVSPCVCTDVVRSECKSCVDRIDARHEIERLRAENQRLTDENARAWNACNEECQRKEELQALIDALYRGEMMPGNRSTNPAWWGAIDALLAAATKENDRG